MKGFSKRKEGKRGIRIAGVLMFLVLSLLSNPDAQAKTEAEGYKGIPWGTEFEKFKEMKNIGAGHDGQTREIVEDGNWKSSIFVVLGAPVYTLNVLSYKMLEVQSRHVPERFYSVYIESDDVTYIFYDGKFAMAFSTLYAKNYDEYLSTLSKKYGNGITDIANKDIMTMGNPPDHDIKRFICIVQKGNTRAYLIKRIYKSPWLGTGSTALGLLCIADNYYKQINGEIGKSKAKKESANSKKEKKNMESDLNKIR